jgi:hypothetical protein
MLSSFFKVALLVTDGVPEYAERRAAIETHYEENVGWWLDVAETPAGYYADPCGDGYYGRNIRFEPMYNLARLETDIWLLDRIRDNVLAGIMWPDVADHKNVFFAFIHAANQDWSDEIDGIVDDHVYQLELFPTAPRIDELHDNWGEYFENPDCPGNTTVATDVDDRVVADFLWQRHPWKIFKAGNVLRVYPGVDYMVAYWMGRHHGFIDDDLPDSCLKWRDL